MRGRKLTEKERMERRKLSQEDYRHRVKRFNLQFNIKDGEARHCLTASEPERENSC